jgi:hypothetical protein
VFIILRFSPILPVFSSSSSQPHRAPEPLYGCGAPSPAAAPGGSSRERRESAACRAHPHKRRIRDTGRQAGRQVDRKRQTETETEREAHRETEIQAGTVRHAARVTDRQRGTRRQAGRGRQRQGGRQERQTETERIDSRWFSMPDSLWCSPSAARGSAASRRPEARPHSSAPARPHTARVSLISGTCHPETPPHTTHKLTGCSSSLSWLQRPAAHAAEIKLSYAPP